uniref:C1q domain-containing protein n=1 Tax=Lates calcarifer TaxID=8187 RepID=A0A4W6G214_LATCA
MRGYYGLAVLVGVDGSAGVAGAPGRDGLPGAKGEKGQPAKMADGPVDSKRPTEAEGEMGNRGFARVMGPKGFCGDLGTAGHPGQPGHPGPDGKSIGHAPSQQARSAFSVMRTDNSYPPYDQRVTYQTTVVNKPEDFNAATGEFICRVPGVYYFTFHSVAKVSMCLRIVTDAMERKVGFCDHNRNNDQVLSGGVVLQLAKDQKVWLESFMDQQTSTERNDIREKKIIFNGFLLFANTE